MKTLSAIGGGIAGAVTLTLIHETVRRLTPNAPRMDLLGMQAIAKTLNKLNVKTPNEHQLFNITMIGDLISNSLYYSLSGFGKEKQAIMRGSMLGLAAGIGAVYLPRPLGLSTTPSSRTFQTTVMTVALYSMGGLVAALSAGLLEKKKRVATTQKSLVM